MQEEEEEEKELEYACINLLKKKKNKNDRKKRINLITRILIYTNWKKNADTLMPTLGPLSISAKRCPAYKSDLSLEVNYGSMSIYKKN